jgi:threonine/homoserine/homoserine lactone efflux protein
MEGSALLLQGIGAGLPAALAVALSPFPVIGIVLILAGPRGRLNGPLFAAGWLLGLSVVTALVAFVFGGTEDPDSPSSAIADWGRVFVGAAMIVVGVRKWAARPRHYDARDAPTWMASLDSATPGRALALGALLSGANPKNFVLAAAAATSMVEAGLHGADLVVAVVVFVLVGSCTVVGAVVVRLVGGRRGESVLEGVRQFMVANSAAITVLVLLILGARCSATGSSDSADDAEPDPMSTRMKIATVLLGLVLTAISVWQILPLTT